MVVGSIIVGLRLLVYPPTEFHEMVSKLKSECQGNSACIEHVEYIEVRATLKYRELIQNASPVEVIKIMMIGTGYDYSTKGKQ